MLKVRHSLLSNGLELLYIKSPYKVTSANLLIKYGSAYEPAKFAGIAHFIEHMFFTGTKRMSRFDISNSIDSIGGRINAFTTKQEIEYYVRVPSRHFQTALNTLAECFNACEFFEKELAVERSIILSEIASIYDNPTSCALHEFESLLLAGSYGRPTIGYKETVAKIKRNNLLNIFNETHTTSNAVLCVVTSISEQKISTLAEELFIHKKSTKTKKSKKARFNKPKFKHIARDTEHLHVCFGFKMPSASSEYYVEAITFASILGSGLSARIPFELREKHGLCYDIACFYEAEPAFGYFCVYFSTSPKNFPKARKLLERIISERKIVQNDLTKAKQYLFGSKTVSWQNSTELAKDALFSHYAGFSWREFFSRLKTLELKELNSFVKDLPLEENFTLLLGPEL